MSDITEEARRLQQVALAGPIGKRHSSFALYRLLSDCMALAVRCMNASEDRQALIDLIKPDEYGKGRSRKGQVNASSSEFQLVCRFVFQHKGTSASAERSNASRYGKTLEEAFKRQIGPTKIESFLREQGGINALFRRRPLRSTSVRTKTLYLTESIDVPKTGEFTITLRRTPENAFEVIAVRSFPGQATEGERS